MTVGGPYGDKRAGNLQTSLRGAQNLLQSGGAPVNPQVKIGDPQQKEGFMLSPVEKGERESRAMTKVDGSK